MGRPLDTDIDHTNCAARDALRAYGAKFSLGCLPTYPVQMLAGKSPA